MLGAKRGADLYDYEKTLHKEFLLKDKFFYALSGSIVYINPMMLWLILSKEIHRLQVNLNGLEKKIDYYELI